ncbi:hypothetical protein MVEN_01384200 [Mycena venus]|uniref:Uncharacterized protein n=1 Tax=Mycena venus TaxID=2733690 RepID=A0A8H7CV99_9AGAR|nr:hypothetical protein MVEN_01384200 [Mycena venus]
MSLENLSKPALEALLAFHADAARRIEEQFGSTEERLADSEDQLKLQLPLADIEASLEDTEEQSGALLSPFNLAASHRRSSAPSSSPSPPSRPVHSALRMPSPPSVSVRTWTRWSADITSPTPAPRHGCKRKHEEKEEEDSNERERVCICIDPGWLRGFTGTPPRRLRLWDKENENIAL